MPKNKLDLLSQFQENHSIEEFEKDLESALSMCLLYNPRKDPFFIKGERISSLENTLFVAYLKAIGRYEDIIEKAEIRVGAGNLPPKIDPDTPDDFVRPPSPPDPLLGTPAPAAKGLVPKSAVKHPPANPIVKKPPVPKKIIPRKPIGEIPVDPVPASASRRKVIKGPLGSSLGGGLRREKVVKRVPEPEPDLEPEPDIEPETLEEMLAPEQDEESRENAFIELLKFMVDRYKEQDFDSEDVVKYVIYLAKQASAAGLMTDIRTYLSGIDIPYAEKKALDSEREEEDVMNEKMRQLLENKDRNALQAKYKNYISKQLSDRTRRLSGKYKECFEGPWIIDHKTELQLPNLTTLTGPERILISLLTFYCDYAKVFEHSLSETIKNFVGSLAEDPLEVSPDRDSAVSLWNKVSEAYTNVKYDVLSDIFYNGLSKNLKFFNVKHNLINVLRVYYTKRKRELEGTKYQLERERGSEEKLALVNEEWEAVSRKAEAYDNAFKTVSQKNWDDYVDEDWTDDLKKEFFTRPPITRTDISAINDMVDLEDVDYLAHSIEWRCMTKRGIKEGQGILSIRDVFENYQNTANKELIHWTEIAQRVLGGGLGLPKDAPPMDVYWALSELTQ